MKIFSAVVLAALGLLPLVAQTTPPEGNPPREEFAALRALPPPVTYLYDCAGHGDDFFLGTDKGLFRATTNSGDIQPWGDLERSDISTVTIANNRILVLHSSGNLPPEVAVAALTDGKFSPISPPWNTEEDGIDIRAVHDRFFAVNENSAFTSHDGKTWAAHPQLANGHLTFANGFWYGFEPHQGGDPSWLIRSADLQKWDRLTALPSGEIFHSLAVDRDIALLGCNDSRLLRIDLKNPAQPESVSFPQPNVYATISSAQGFFWLQTNQLHFSADGKTWRALETLNAALSPAGKPGIPPSGLRHFFLADSFALLANRDTPARFLPISFANLSSLAQGTLTLRPDPTPPLVKGRYAEKLVPGTRKIIQSRNRLFALTAEGRLYAAYSGQPWNWITLKGKLNQPGVKLIDIATDGEDSLQLAIHESHEETRNGKQVTASYHRIETYPASGGFERRTSAFFPGAQPPAQLHFLGGRFFAILADGSLLAGDAQNTWKRISLPADAPQGVRGIAKLGDHFVLPLRHLTGTLLTGDFQNWEKIPVSLGNPSEKTFLAANAGRHLFIFSGEKLFLSADAKNWTTFTGFDLPENSRFLGAAADNSQHWLAFDSALFVSSDSAARHWRKTTAAPHSFFPLPHGIVAQNDTGLVPFSSAPDLLRQTLPLALSIRPADTGFSEVEQRLLAAFVEWDNAFSAAADNAARRKTTETFTAALYGPGITESQRAPLRQLALQRFSRCVPLDEFLAVANTHGIDIVAARFQDKGDQARVRRTLLDKLTGKPNPDYSTVNQLWKHDDFPSPKKSAPEDVFDYDIVQFQHRAAFDDVGAAYDLGNFYLNGTTTLISQEAASWWGRRAIALGYKSPGTDKKSLLEDNRRQGSLIADYVHWQQLLGTAEKGSASYDPTHELARLFDQGVIAAARTLAQWYFDRDDAEGDALTFAWAKRGALQGDAYCMTILAGLYGEGVGTAPDLPLALSWYEKAFALGITSVEPSVTQIKSLIAEGKTRLTATDGAFKKLAKEIDSGALEERAALREELENLPPSGEFNKVSDKEIFQKSFSLGEPTPLQSVAPENAIRLAATANEFPFLVHALEVNGTLAACGENGFLAEWNGSAWQPVRTLSAETFVRLASDGKRFFAVGNRGALVSWTPGQPDRASTRVFPDTAFTGLAHGAGRFVATGSFEGVLVSANGADWELRPYQKQYAHSTTLTQNPVVYGAGKFFVPDTNPISRLLGFVSEDGLTWSEVFLAGDTRLFRPKSFGKFSFGFNSWDNVAFAAGNRLFIAGELKGEKNTPAVLTSTDGINWEPVKGRLGNLPFSFEGAAFHQGRYLSLPASDGKRIALSSDGVTWDIKTLRQPEGDDATTLANALLGSPMSYTNFAPCHLLARADGTWVATGKAGLAFSADGTLWENNAFNVPMAPPGGTIPARWVVSGDRALRFSPHIKSGVLGADGEIRPFKGFPQHVAPHAIGTDGKIWVAFSSAVEQTKSQNLGGEVSLESKEKTAADTLRAWSSTDGETWTAVPCPPDTKGYKTRIHAVTHTGTAFIAVGSNAAILRSTDGKTWTREALGEDLRAFADMPENTLPAGKPTRSAWRIAQENSTEKTVRSIYALESVAALKGIVLAATPREIFLSADDGKTWRWTGWYAAHLRHLAAARDAFWLTGSTFDTAISALYRSTDGVNWQSVLVAPRDKNPVTQKNPTLLSFFAEAGQLAVTTNDSILTSPDGTVWNRHYVADQPITQLLRHNTTWLAEIDSRRLWLHSAKEIPPPLPLPVNVANAAAANAAIRTANPEPLYQDGLAYEQGKLGESIDQRILHASIAYNQAADAGHAPAMMGLVRVHIATLQHRPQITPEARAEYEKEIIELVGRAAEKNFPEAIRFRAEWYLNGQAGFPKDVAKGIAEYKRAAEMGDWPAMRLLGGIYFQGQHIPRDLKLAEYWLEKARAAGDPQAAQLLQSIRQGEK